MSAIHQIRRPAQAGRIVTAMVVGSRTADTEPSETDTHPGSGVLINWLGITGPAEWKTVEISVIAQRMALGHPPDLHQQPHGHELQLPYRSSCVSRHRISCTLKFDGGDVRMMIGFYGFLQIPRSLPSVT